MDIHEYYGSRKQLVDKAVQDLLRREGLDEISPTPKGGKRLRGVLTLLVCEALGGKPEQALDAAVAVELAHAASLDADDIVDLDQLRRGKPATWVTKGVIKAVVGSHALVAASLRLVEKYGMKAVEYVHKAYFDMVRGEAMDTLKGGIYETIIALKTAPLWGAAAALGAIAAKADDETVEKAYRYGVASGIAFQVADDIVDVIKVVEKGEIHRIISHPSSAAFLAWLGLRSLLDTSPFKVIMGGLSSVAEKAKETAMKKLEEKVAEAQQLAEQLPAKTQEYRILLREYPVLSVDMMLIEITTMG